MSAIWSRLSYANVMATIAVIIALGGGAYAAKRGGKGGGRKIGTAQLKNGAVTGPKVRNQTLGLSKLVGASGTATNTTAVSRPPGTCGRYLFSAPNAQPGDAVILAGTDINAIDNAIVGAPTVPNPNTMDVTVCAGNTALNIGAGAIQLRFDTLR